MGYELCPIKDKQELQTIIDELESIGFFMISDIREGVLDTEKAK